MSDKPGRAPSGIAPEHQASAVDFLTRGYQFGEQMDLIPPQNATWAPSEPNPIESYFDGHKEGPGLWKWRHYFDVYHRHFSRFVGRDITVVEIGVFCGGSLGMWKYYFGPRCKIFGIDVMENCRTFEGGQVKILIGDQSDQAFLDRVKSIAPVVDIIIDDGSHWYEHQIASFEGLFPHLAPGGVYLCEDIYMSHNPFQDYINGVTHRLNAMSTVPKPGLSDHHDGMLTNAVQREVHSIHQYPYVTVIEKRHKAMTEFSAPRRGTEWMNRDEWVRRSVEKTLY